MFVPIWKGDAMIIVEARTDMASAVCDLKRWGEDALLVPTELPFHWSHGIL